MKTDLEATDIMYIGEASGYKLYIQAPAEVARQVAKAVSLMALMGQMIFPTEEAEATPVEQGFDSPGPQKKSRSTRRKPA